MAIVTKSFYADFVDAFRLTVTYEASENGLFFGSNF